MQSSRDSGRVTSLQKARGSDGNDVDFGEGEPYLDNEEDVAYLKKIKSGGDIVSSLKKGVGGTSGGNSSVRRMSNEIDGEENIYGNTVDMSPGTSKQGSPLRKDREKDSLEAEYDNDSESSLSDDDADVRVSSFTKNQKANKREHKDKKSQSVSERLSRDAMSLRRHQLRKPMAIPEEVEGRKKKKKPESKPKESVEHQKPAKTRRQGDESRKRVGDNKKSFKASHELYGEEYPTKFPLPPRSPTFSFRSTIDLLPSSHNRQGLRQQIIVTFSCCLGPFACGFAQAYILAISMTEMMGVNAGVWETYAYYLGCIGGGFFSGLLVNLGRKRTLLLSMTPFALAWLALIFATEVWMALLFHATAGTCTALVMVLAQVYVGEVATPGVRGAVSCAPLLAMQLGGLFCYVLGDVLMWRHLAAVGMSLSLPFFVAVVLCMPESPRFLVHVRPNDALATLQWLRGVDSEVMEEYRDIADNSETDRWTVDLDDLSRPTFWRPLLLSCGLMFLFNMTGLSSFGLYGMELFAEVSHRPMNVAYFINSTIVIIGIVIASILVDQIGRKLLLLLSITIMAASAFTIGLFMFLKDYNKVESYFEYQWAAEVFCVVLFTFAHGTGMGPIAWITMGEVFGPRHKWIGVTFSSMVFWASMVAVDVLFHHMRHAVLTGGIFWFHCVVCVGGYIFVLLCFRELKEQRIDDISKSFTKKHDSLIDTFITRA